MSFAEAQQAMTEAFGGGKINPSNLNQQTGVAPDSSPSKESSSGSGPFKNDIKGSEETQSLDSSEGTGQAEELTPQQAEELLDLMSLGKKIKIGDDVFTPEELKRANLRWKDYTTKTQELAKIRKEAEDNLKFRDAFEADLEKLLADPDQWEDTFRKIYPESYQKIYDRIKASREFTSPQSTRSHGASEQQVSPELQKILSTVKQMDSRLSTYEQQAREAQIEKEATKLDNMFLGLHKKYDLGDQKANDKIESLVLMRAQNLDRDPTQKDFERFFKEEFEAFDSLRRAHGEKQFRGQQAANQQGKDIATGGGTASGAPQTPKTFKEARDAMEKHLSMQGR